MPHLRFRALPPETVAKLSAQLPRELAPLMNTTEDNFTIERIETHFYRDGAPSDGDPFVEVLWFDRGAEVRDRAARAITERVRALAPAPFIAVVFTAIPPEAYYENGSPF